MENNDLKTRKREWWFVLPPLLVGIFLRFADLGKQALFLDEAFTADLVLRSWRDMIQTTLADVHPPLFYILLKPMVAYFPLTEWTLRSLSAVSSVLALILAMGFARRLAGRGAAIMTGWVLAWSAFHLYYAQEARMYSLLDVCWILAAFSSLYAWRDGKNIYWLVWCLSTIAAIYTQLYGFLLWSVGAFGGLVFSIVGRKWQTLRWWAISQTIVFATAAPLISLMIKVAQGGVGGTWTPSWKDPLDLLALILFGFPSVRDHFLNSRLLAIQPWDFSRNTGELLLLIPVGLALIGWLKVKNSNSKWLGWLISVYALLPLGAATLLLGITGKRFWAYRPFIGVATLAVIGLSAGWHLVLPRRFKIALVGLLFTLNLGSLWAYKMNWVKDYGRSAFTSLPDQQTLLLDRSYTAYVFNFYQPDWKEDIFGLVPRSNRAYDIVRITQDNTLYGPIEIISCDELPSPIALYDPAGRRFNESDRWPSCLRERSGWLFNPANGQWEETSRLIP